MVKDVVINIFYQVSQSVGSFGRSSGSGGYSSAVQQAFAQNITLLEFEQIYFMEIIF